MNTCSTCAHWGRDRIGEYQWDKRMLIGGFCHCPKIQEEGEFESDSMNYSYREGGQFWTGPEFGCVHHKTLDNA